MEKRNIPYRRIGIGLFTWRFGGQIWPMRSSRSSSLAFHSRSAMNLVFLTGLDGSSNYLRSDSYSFSDPVRTHVNNTVRRKQSILRYLIYDRLRV
jgi:hypothetical protein